METAFTVTADKKKESLKSKGSTSRVASSELSSTNCLALQGFVPTNSPIDWPMRRGVEALPGMLLRSNNSKPISCFTMEVGWTVVERSSKGCVFGAIARCVCVCSWLALVVSHCRATTCCRAQHCDIALPNWFLASFIFLPVSPALDECHKARNLL